MAPPHRIVARTLVGAVVIAFMTLSLTSIAAGENPRILLDPDTTKSGEKVTVFGFDFCADDGCSLVRIVLEEEVVAADVEVGPDGRFAVAFEAQAPPGIYDVVAIQDSGTDGEHIEVVAQLTLGVGEQKPGGRRPIPT